MRFLMIGISIIIGVILVGVVFSVTTDLTQPRGVEKVVSFEILTLENDEFGEGGHVTNGTFENFNVYFNGVHEKLTLVDIKINNETILPIEKNGYVIYDDIANSIVVVEYIFIDFSFITIYDDDYYYVRDYTFTVGDQISITFMVNEPPQISSTSAILITLVPLLFATGVILYTYNTALRGRDD